MVNRIFAHTCVRSWDQMSPKVHLHEDMQDFNKGKFVTPLKLGLIGRGIVPGVECKEPNAGARKCVRGGRLPCTNWLGAKAASLRSPRQGKTNWSREIVLLQ